MIVGLEVIVEHVEAVERLLGLLAEGGDALVDLVDHAIFSARHASHERGQHAEALRAEFFDERGELFDAFHRGARVARLEDVLVAHVHEHHLSLDRVMHLERAAQVVDAAAANELDRLELLGWIELELLHGLILMLILVLRLMRRLLHLILTGVIGHGVGLKVAIQGLELRDAHYVSDNEKIALQAQRELESYTRHPRHGGVLVFVGIVQADHLDAERVQRLLVDALLRGKDPEGGVELFDALQHVRERAIDAGVEEPNFAVFLESGVGTAGGRGTRLQVGVETNVGQIVVEFALTREKLLVVGLVHLGAHHADLLLGVVEQKPERLQTDRLADLFSVLRHAHDARQ